MDTKTKMILDNAKVLIFDIEASSLDVDTAITRVVGVKTNKSSKVHCIWAKDFDKLRKAIKKADFIVTYNGNNYDIPVLLNDYNKLFKYETSLTGKHIDLFEVVTNREATFGTSFIEGFSLDAVCKTLGLSRKVQDFDYNLLKKDYDELTKKEITEIEHYLQQDVEITNELYNFIEEMYQPLATFLSKSDVRKKNYIKSSMGAITYKVICHMSGLQPTYDGTYEDDGLDTYKGGHVFEPVREKAIGNIKCVDYTSAYPHAYMQANLYTKCKHCVDGDCQYRYTGGTTPDGHTLELQGEYCTLGGMGVREKVIQRLFLLRLDAKNKIKSYQQRKNNGEILSSEEDEDLNYLNKFQQGLKIVINTIYGISGSPKFLQTYDEDTAADCTLICRFNLLYLHNKLVEFGNEHLYGDTDSEYILCPNDLDDLQLQEQLNEIIANLKSIYPFPQDTFKIDIEDTMKFMGFFSDEYGIFKKKKYVMVMDNDKVKVKGLSIVRRDSSFLARRIWNEHITDYIRTNLSHKIPLSHIDAWISDLVEADIENASVEFKVKPLEMYNSSTSIQSKISEELGEGKHKLIKNRRGIGIGKGVSYATLDEAKNFTIADIDLSRVYSDLSDVTDSAQKTFTRFMV